MPADVAPEIQYVLLIFGMFVVSRFLQRFRLPSAITCIAIGLVFGMGLGVLQDEPTVKLMAVLGIVSMFLFAGMEIDFSELRREKWVLAQHLALQVLGIALAAYAAFRLLNLAPRPAVLVGLALMSPSTGFILDALPSLGVTPSERFWIKSMAIATEIVALGVLFFVLQSSSYQFLSVSIVTLVAMVVLLPLLFRVFAKIILPFAPKTEFAFLVIVALLCASVTKKLGVYYLVGAFVVGVTEQRLRKKLPTLASERLLESIEVFASFFIPFYFLKAGLGLKAENFELPALGIGLAFLLAAVPLRLLLVVVHRRLVLREQVKDSVRIGVSTLPTLVFTIVIAEILRDQFGASPSLVGGLIIYTLANTLIPGFTMRTPVLEFETPEIPDPGGAVTEPAPPAAEPPASPPASPA